MSKTYAETRMSLSEGGQFFMAWPQNINPASMRQVRDLGGAVLAGWVNELERRAAADGLAGEREYQSWFSPAAPKGTGD